MKSFTDTQLISSFDNIVRREREILADVLNHFQEFDRRKLFSKLGYTSLHEYAIKHHKYSDDQAYRRIQAMRLMREIPEIENKIEEGSLTLSSLSQAQSFFRKVEHTKDQKKEILAQLENTTKREAQKICQQDSNVRYSFEADESLEKIVERLRGLNPHLNFDQLMKKVCELALKQIDPAAKHRNKKAPSNGKDSCIERKQPENRVVMKPCEIADTKFETSSRTEHRPFVRKYISVNLKRDIWTSSQNKCKNCGSTFALEIDHIIPIALGGKSEASNYQLLCRNCNQRKGIEQLGLSKMTNFRLLGQ